jgi:hypothetical protein
MIEGFLSKNNGEGGERRGCGLYLERRAEEIVGNLGRMQYDFEVFIMFLVVFLFFIFCFCYILEG